MILIKQKKFKSQKGLTVIELMVVIVIISAALTMGYQLLKSVWSAQLAGTTPTDINSIIEYAHKESLSIGETIILEFNLEKRVLALKKLDSFIKNESFNVEANLFSDTASDDTNDANDDDVGDTDEEIRAKKAHWISDKIDIPGNFVKIYNVSGQLLKGPVVDISFYPDGSSDPFIIEYKRKEKPYEYIPRYPLEPVPLSSITEFEGQEE